MPAAPSETITAELDRLHEALRDGRLGDLNGVAAALAGQIDGLSGLTFAALEDVRRRAVRNAACLQAARQGVRAARRRLDEIRMMGVGFVSYDSRGKRDEGPAPAGQLVQRL